MSKKWPDKLTVPEAAEYTGLKPSYLNSLRATGRSGGPEYDKAPGLRGRITYNRAALKLWNDARLATAKAAKAAVGKPKPNKPAVVKTAAPKVAKPPVAKAPKPKAVKVKKAAAPAIDPIDPMSDSPVVETTAAAA